MSAKNTIYPKFSIVIPAYNEESYIEKTINSLKNQSYKGSIEIIVVDNNSTDQTAMVAKKCGVKVIFEPIAGVCHARQKGTSEAHGEYIISADADTFYPKDWLQQINNNFESNSKIVGVAGPCKFSDAPFWGNIFTFILFGLSSIVYKIFNKTLYASATNIAFKKNAWKGYNTSINQGGDELDLLSKLQKEGIVKFDNTNPSLTSSRRIIRGFVYNFFVTFLIFYLLEYCLSKIFKRPVLGAYPQFRNNKVPRTLSYFQLLLIISFLILITLFFYRQHIKDIAGSYLSSYKIHNITAGGT